MEEIYQRDDQESVEKLNIMKLELLDKFPMLIYRILKYKFPETDTTEPSDTETCYKEVEAILY